MVVVKERDDKVEKVAFAHIVRRLFLKVHMDECMMEISPVDGIVHHALFSRLHIVRM